MSENINTTSTSTEKHGIIGKTSEGKQIAFARNVIRPTGAGNNAINVRIPDLKEIGHIISKNTVTDGIYHQSISGDVITGNQVGTTIFQVSGGGTITLEVIAVER